MLLHTPLLTSATGGEMPLTPTQMGLALAIVMTWVGHFITLWKFRNDLKAAEEKRQADLITLITTIARREVESYHHTEEHGRRLDTRIQTAMRFSMEEEFSKRARSFVDAGVYDAKHSGLQERVKKLEDTQLATAKEIGALASAVSTTNAYLKAKFGFERD